jgi:hypothetical protein
MIPSGYKEDVVYSQIPTNGSGDLSFTRASNGTRINSAGLVEVCPWNLYSYSEIFSGGGWFNDGTSTATNNFATAPNGTMTAAKVVANTANGYAYKSTIVAPNTYTLSYYVRASANTTMSIAINDPGGSGSSVKSNIAVTTQWQRIEHSALVTLGTSFYIDYAALQTGVDYFIWGAQVNLGSTAKPYFPTTDRLNVPRLTYQNGGGGCPSLLLEKQSTNLFTYSEQMDNSDWFKNNLTITANSTTSPDGTQNADLLDDGTASSTQHWIYQGTSFSNSTAYTISFYAKYVSRKYMAVNIYNGSTSQYVVYDIQNGSVYGSTGDVTASITSVGNGWYRVVYTRTMSASGSPNFRIAMADDTGNETYTGSNKQVYLWGMQCEASSYPTSYIVSTSSSATRVADACFKTGIGSLIGQTEGVLFADVNWIVKPEAGSPIVGILTLNNNVANLDNCIILGIERQSGGTNRVYSFVQNSGSTVAGLFGSNITNGRYKIAFAYKNNDFVLYVNGVQIATDTSGTPPTTSEVLVGQRFQGDSFLMNDSINETVLFKTRLTNAELASLTTL